VPRLLPATEHTAWLGAHAPGALLPRASWTTGAWAPSSRGLFGISRPLAGPDPKEIPKWSGLLARCLSEAGRVRAARGRPSVLAERLGQTTHKSAGRHAQQCVWHAGLCGTSVRSQLTIFFIANGRQRQEEKGRLMMTRGGAGTSKPASWSKKGQKMPCDARDNADGRGDEDEEDRTQPTKCNVTGSMGRHLAQLA
jgi:hypothetical protein